MGEPAPLPSNEPERLRVLRDYGILDTAPEAVFDDLTHLASYICDTPIALVSLVDAERQWFKSRVGLDVSETPREVAFCAHAILASEVMEIPDALADGRFSDNPLVTGDPHIRFYAGAPLVASSGQALGTLCVIDRRVRQLSGDQREALRALARQVVTQLEWRRHIEQLGRLTRERDSAGDAIRQNEQTLRDLFDGASDLIQIVSRDGHFLHVNRAWHQALGYTEEDLPGLNVFDIIVPELQAHCAALFARVMAGESATDVEAVFRAKDGRLIEVEGNVTPRREASVVSTRGFFRDVTARRRTERRLAIQHVAARVLAESESVEVAAPKLLQGVCDNLRWAVGALWLVDAGEEVLRSVAIWSSPAAEFEPFVTSTRQTVFPRGVGLPGRVWAHAASAWIQDVTQDANFPRASVAASCGLRGAFAVPILQHGLVLGVAEFFSRTVQPPDEELLDTMAALGSQIGQFIDRRTADEALRANEARTRAIIDNLLEGLLTADERGVIESVNPAAARIFGYTQEELIGQHVRTLLPLPPEQADAFLRDAHKQAIGRVSEWDVRRKSGERFPIELALFEFQTASGPRFAGNCRDISERREVERLKQEFVSTVSHELRTPLTSIRGSLGLLASGALGDLPGEARALVEMAERNTVRLVSLINDILDLERLGSGRLEMHFDRGKVATIIERAVDAVRSFANEQRIRIDVEATDVTIWADADRVVQVLVNLLSNAVKFSPEGSTVTVSVVPRGGMVDVQVRDHGRGIPASHRETIFERFSQVEASDARQKGGSGLGLAICKAIVEKHGGAIGVESEEGRGSTFWFRLPVAPQPPDQAGAVPTNGTAVLLCVDADTQGYLARVLREVGLIVVLAGSPGEAWTLLQQTDAVLAVIDADDRGFDGQDLLARIRRDTERTDFPVILIGSSVLLASHTVLDRLAVFLPHPVQEQELLAAVRSALHRERQTDVLLVEDDLPLLDVIARQFTAQGIRVRTATTGRDAIRLAEERRPGLLVLDVALPEGDGYTVVESLRSRPGLDDIPVLVYSGMDLSDEQRGKLRLGPTRFLTKSKATVDDFYTLVQELRRSREAPA